MDSVSRPLLVLLLGTVAVFAVWLVALKPSPSGGGGSAASPGVYPSAIAKAHAAVATSAAASIAHRGTVVTPVQPATRPAVTAALPSSTPSRPVAKTGAVTGRTTPARPASATPERPASTNAAARRSGSVARALRAKKTLALLFYNAAATDDRAVRAELSAVPSRGGRVVRLAVPLAELARYSVVTSQVTVNASPTLVIIDRAHRASTIVGFADRFEIAQRVADALAGP